MKRHLFILSLLIITFVTTILTAQSGESLKHLTAFAELDAHLAKNSLDFDNDEETVKLFNQERIRLGANFETELWKYLGQDLRKHYWISSFVESKYYLNNNKPLPELAKRIRSNAQDFPVKSDDYEFLGMKFTILRDIVRDLYLDKQLSSAKLIKQKAERIYKDIESLGVVGATDEYTWCVYENLEKNPEKCKQESPR